MKLSGRAETCIVALAVALCGAGALLSAPTAETAARTDGPALHTVGPYRVYTDLTPPKLWEATARLKHMARLYQRQTAGFDGTLTGPLPVFLYSDQQDFQDALDRRTPRSAGIYTGSELRAIIDTDVFSRESIWHVIQHEGFHQVAHRVIARPGVALPLWVNEGLAEYFGEALWTGTRLVPGAIDAGGPYSKVPVRGGRAGRIRRRLAEDVFRPLDELMDMTAQQWRDDHDATSNYDQVYAVVHYLIHGDGGRHHQAFARYVNDVARGRPNLATFKKHFGRSIELLDASWRQWWTDLPADPTTKIHAIVAAETLANSLARSAQADSYASDDTLIKAARDGDLLVAPGRKTYMPTWVIRQAGAAAPQIGPWTLHRNDGRTVLSVTLANDMIVSAVIPAGRDGRTPPRVTIDITPPPAPDARPAVDDGSPRPSSAGLGGTTTTPSPTSRPDARGRPAASGRCRRPRRSAGPPRPRRGQRETPRYELPGPARGGRRASACPWPATRR
ncbi:MAG: DUF1570 domain-containing protein [Planctomycetes bacterium]|jgi:hypothetical protein|nr:DUF1570 domain-containing protein [Phycisphaerae bacterium]NBB95285.1 DUF1570 domain-containing protein [Planctomycetota bacterium]